MTMQSLSAVATKTIQQIKPGVREILLIEWGYTLNNAPGAPVEIELIAGNVAATVTANAAADIVKYNNPLDSASTVVLGTTSTGYNASAEGTISASRLIDFHFENGLWVNKQYPLAREPLVMPADWLRVRVTPGSTATIQIASYVTWEE
jgi:hypothetical protein